MKKLIYIYIFLQEMILSISTHVHFDKIQRKFSE